MSIRPMSIKDMDVKEQEFRISHTDKEGGISNPREKLLIILAFIFLVLVLSLLAAIVISIALGNLFRKPNFCLTKNCTIRAGRILQSLNKEVNPCDDFYEYSCGNWEDDNVFTLPDVGVLEKQQLKVLRDMNRIVRDINYNTASVVEKKVKKAYDKCIDLFIKDKRIKTDYEDLFNEYGGFPLFEISPVKPIIETEIQIAKLFRSTGAEPILGISVESNEDNNKENILVLSPPDMSLFAEENITDDIHELLESFVIDPDNKALTSVVELYQKIRKILITMRKENYEEKLILTNDTESITKLGFVGFDLKKLSEELMKELKPKNPDEKTQLKSGIVANYDSLFRRKGKNIRKRNNDDDDDDDDNDDDSVTKSTNATISTEVTPGTKSTTPSTDKTVNKEDTPPSPESEPNTVITGVKEEVLKVLIKYPAKVKDILALTSDKAVIGDGRKVLDNYLSVQLLRTYGLQRTVNTENESVRVKCLLDVSRYLNFAFDNIYINHYNASLDKAQDIIKHVKGALANFMDGYKWLDDETRRIVKSKLENMKHFIGYPRWISNNTLIEEYYRDMDATDNDVAIKFYTKMLKFNQEQILKQIYKENKRDEWPNIPEFSVTTVNAFYLPDSNVFVLPSAIINTPLLDVNVPNYLNFGSLGTVIGHEITHGFDTNGRLRNSYGNLPKYNETWSDFSTKNYKAGSNCFIDQYNGFKIGEDKVDGKLTLAENIADNGAIREALEGYRNWIKQDNNGKAEDLLPALDKFTPEQMFYISFAQSWCHTANRKSIQRKNDMDVHTPNKFRVIGSLQNSEDFSKAFKCDKEYMNRVHKCKLW